MKYLILSIRVYDFNDSLFLGFFMKREKRWKQTSNELIYWTLKLNLKTEQNSLKEPLFKMHILCSFFKYNVTSRFLFTQFIRSVTDMIGNLV